MHSQPFALLPLFYSSRSIALQTLHFPVADRHRQFAEFLEIAFQVKSLETFFECVLALQGEVHFFVKVDK